MSNDILDAYKASQQRAADFNAERRAERAKPLAVVHTLFEHNARQIPECMTHLANEIAAGRLGVVTSAVCVLEDDKGRLGLFFWGDMKSHDLIALLQRGQQKACKTLDEGDIPHDVVPAV